MPDIMAGGELGGSPDDDILTLRPTGFWTPEASRMHFNALAERLAVMRQKHGRANVLVDLRQAQVQASENAAQMEAGIDTAYEAGDRIAVLTGSALLTLQVKRMAGPAAMRFCATEAEGLAFLMGQ